MHRRHGASPSRAVSPPSSSPSARLMALAVALALCSLPSRPPSAAAFSPSAPPPSATSAGLGPPALLSSSSDRDRGDDDVARQLAKARELLARARTKLDGSEPGVLPTVDIALTSEGDVITEKAEEEEEEEGGGAGGGEDGGGPLPFFASDPSGPARRRDSLSKSLDESTGLRTFDGDKMASLSASEKWQVRPIAEVFEDEIDEERKEAYNRANRQLSERDVAANIWNLRKSLRTEDFEKIFDKRNWFIGEE